MASIFAPLDLAAASITAATNNFGQTALAPLRRFFQARVGSREEKARRVAVTYLARHADEELIRWGYSAIEIQAFRREALAWQVPFL